MSFFVFRTPGPAFRLRPRVTPGIRTKVVPIGNPCQIVSRMAFFLPFGALLQGILSPPLKKRALGCDSLPKCSPSKFCAPVRPRKTRVLGAKVCREALFRFYALPVIARQRRCRSNPIECRNLTTLPTDSHAHFRSLGMTSPTHARRQFRGDGLPGGSLPVLRPPRHCEVAQVP